MSATCTRVVVLGGGTAGWMAACLFARAWGDRADVAVVESAEIGIVGVGEGSTPQLRAFFAELGVAEAEWMPRCNATYKNGIRFRGWSERPGHESYFHPFASALDLHTEPLFFANARRRRQGLDVPAHPDRYYVAARLAERRLGPLPAEHFPFDIGYGYHFDAHLVGAFLRDHAAGLGARRLERRVAKVDVGEDGNVRALVATDGERIGGDLFVDCSGFRSVIAQGALGVRFLPFAENLFNDAAVVMPTPHRDANDIAPETASHAMRHGWRWEIPLTNRVGNGYVYSTAHCSPDEAEAELRAALGVGDEPAARHLAMKVGRVERSWAGNCLAVGLSQGFIEPLEATALHIVQATVEGFIGVWDAGRGTPEHRDAFNGAIAARYEGIRDYIVLHYRANRRTDTPYWRDNAANDRLSDSLKAIITCWFTGGDLSREIEDQGIARYYAPLSWHCLLAGYGAFPADGKLRAPPPGTPGADLAALDDFVARCSANFRSHGELLAAARPPLAA